MARPPRPWRRGPDGPWYAQVRGKQVRLAGPAATRDEARDALARVLAGVQLDTTTNTRTVRDALNLLLADRQGRIITWKNLANRCRTLARTWGHRGVQSIRPPEIEAWIARSGWTSEYQRALVGVLRAAIRLCVRSGHLDRDPLTDLRRPRATRRTFDLDARERLIAAAPEPFRSYLMVLHLTGMRPGELADATARDLDVPAGTLTVRNKTRRQTGSETRTVYLPDPALRILATAAITRPDGPLLRTARGAAWHYHSRDRVWNRVRKQARTNATLYVFRAGWISDALATGISPAIVAELAGHSSLVMMRHYARLASKSNTLREAASRVRPGPVSNETESER